jgi:hypothetical protein
MLKYLLLSSVIVIATAVAVAAWANRDLIRIKIASVYARVPAKSSGGATPAPDLAATLSGDAPWALSALPECLTQVSESTGSTRYVRAHLPAGSVAIRPPATLRYGDCRIAIDGEQAVVRRGADRLRIPPRVAFYRAGRLLASLRETGTSAELRVYAPSQQ